MFENPAIVPHNVPDDWNLPFINLVINIKTDLSIFQLLKEIKEIEKKMGRDLSAKRWSPRIIDIDIILFNKLNYSYEYLTVPHPQMKNRDFVFSLLQEVL